MTFLMRIADRVINRPLLVMPEKAAVIVGVLAGRLGPIEQGPILAQVARNMPESNRFVGHNVGTGASGTPERKPYRQQDGVGILSVVGALVNRGAWLGQDSSTGEVSYEGLQHQINTMEADPGLHSVIIDLDTPGGEAVGAFETSAAVRRLAATKRVIAVVNGMAASAGYAIASGAHEIVTTETGVNGSIGVVLLHADYSKNLEQKGISPTLIFAGAHKVDGNPFEPLPDSVREDLQAEVDAFYSKFLATVALGRGERLSADMARATEARTFIGEDAVKRGLADRVGTFEMVLSDLTNAHGHAAGGRQPSEKRSKSMAEKPSTPAAETEAGFTQAQLDAAIVAARQEGEAAGRAAATTERESALAADRERVSAILDIAEPGAETIVSEGIKSGASAADVALSIAKSADVKEARKRSAALAGLQGDDAGARGASPATAGEDNRTFPQTEDGWKAEWEASAPDSDLRKNYLKAEHYVAAKKREAKKGASK
ncbi:MAG: S49 family peptidase [Hyphomicrobiaceae bacterium]|nr:S49 family peptidase [Hyphomicrobiaceae bacterium]